MNPSMPRVLVVDDEPLIRWSLAETLAESGYLVTEAGDAAAARRAVKKGPGAASPFDVVLLDYRLPDSDNLDLLADIRTAVPRAQVMLMTAFGTPEVIAGALRLGVYRVVGKPVDMGEVRSLVGEACRVSVTH
jgi:two-component system nitrogen regulation response regulator GlnG